MKNEENKVVDFEAAQEEIEKVDEKKGIINAFKELSTPKKIAIGAAGVLVIAGGVVLGRHLMVKPNDIPVEEVVEAVKDAADEAVTTKVEI